MWIKNMKIICIVYTLMIQKVKTNAYTVKVLHNKRVSDANFDATSPRMRGSDLRLLETVVCKLDINVEFIPHFGTPNEGVERLGNGSADVFMGTLAFSHFYTKYAYMAYHIYQREVVFGVKRPKKVGPYQALRYPFDDTTWTFYWGTIILVFTTLLLIKQLDQYRGKQNVPDSFDLFVMTLGSLINTTISDRSFTSYNSHAHGSIVRSLLFVWIPCGFLVVSAYRSTLLASLVRVDYQTPIDTFEDLYKSDIILAVPKGTMAPILLRTSPRQVVRDVYERNTKQFGGEYSWTNPDEVKKVERGILAGTHAKITRPMNLIGKLDLVMPSVDTLQISYSGWLYNKQFHLRNKFDIIILRLQDTGIVGKLMEIREWYKRRPERDRFRRGETRRFVTKKSEGQTVIGLSHFLVLWLMLGIGLLLSVTTFVAEFHFKKIRAFWNKFEWHKNTRIIQIEPKELEKKSNEYEMTTVW